MKINTGFSSDLKNQSKDLKRLEPNIQPDCVLADANVHDLSNPCAHAYACVRPYDNKDDLNVYLPNFPGLQIQALIIISKQEGQFGRGWQPDVHRKLYV